MKEERRILISARIFAPTVRCLEALQRRRERCAGDDITARYDAFMLDPGLGPPVYLSSDGRIIWDDDIRGVVGTRGEAFSALAAGCKRTGVVELLELIPPRPVASADCSECAAAGWFDFHGRLKDTSGTAFSVVCMKCAGLGWTAPSVILTESVLEGRAGGADDPR